MTPSPARQGWTFGQSLLAAACITIGVGIAVFGFTDLYITITHLIAPWWGSWAWTVILLGEGAALGAYLAGLLADLRLTRAPLTLSVFLTCYLALFVTGSLTLMISAGWGSAPDLVSHAIVPVSFFGYLLLAKVLVRHLSAQPPTGLDIARADARRYAMDVLRDRKGIAWRWRPSVPSLLRRQVLTSRFPAVVASAVQKSLNEYGDPWEPAVRDWVLGCDGLNLTAQADVASQRAAETIRQESAAVVPETPHQGERTQPGPPHVTRDWQQKASRQPGRDLTPEALADLARAELPPVPVPSVNALMALAEEHAGTIGRPKAKRAHEILNAGRVQLAPSRAAGS